MRKKHIQMSINGLVALKYTLRPVVAPNFLGKFGNGSLSIWQRITFHTGFIDYKVDSLRFDAFARSTIFRMELFVIRQKIPDNLSGGI